MVDLREKPAGGRWWPEWLKPIGEHLLRRDGVAGLDKVEGRGHAYVVDSYDALRHWATCNAVMWSTLILDQQYPTRVRRGSRWPRAICLNPVCISASTSLSSSAISKIASASLSRATSTTTWLSPNWCAICAQAWSNACPMVFKLGFHGGHSPDAHRRYYRTYGLGST